jgi:hypothetical protein
MKVILRNERLMMAWIAAGAGGSAAGLRDRRCGKRAGALD